MAKRLFLLASTKSPVKPSLGSLLQQNGMSVKDVANEHRRSITASKKKAAIYPLMFARRSPSRKDHKQNKRCIRRPWEKERCQYKRETTAASTGRSCPRKRSDIQGETSHTHTPTLRDEAKWRERRAKRKRGHREAKKRQKLSSLERNEGDAPKNVAVSP